MSSSQPPNQPQNVSWRDQRRIARQERRAARFGSRGGAWVGGAILILLGLGFLLQNTGTILFGNWWALFFLLPAVGSFAGAWRSFSVAGQFTGRVVGLLIAGIAFTVLTLALFFSLDLTWIGPVLLIGLGFGVLVAALMRPASS